MLVEVDALTAHCPADGPLYALYRAEPSVLVFVVLAVRVRVADT